MLYIALTVVTWIPSVLGYGSLLRYSGDTALRRAVTGMLGLGVLAVLGTVLHFLVPLDPDVSAVAWLLGTILFWRRRQWLLEGMSRWEILGATSSLVVFVLLMQPPWRLYDAGLYYLQAVKWISERRIEIGLANLHNRLAINNVWFVSSAMLQHPLAAGESAYFVNLLPMTFAAAAATVAMARLARGDRSFPTIAMAAVLLPLAHATEGLGAQAPDQALTVLVPFTLVLWARALESREEAFAADARAAILLSILATMVKLSAAPLAIGGAVVLLVRRRTVADRWFASVAALTAIAVVPWILRSVLLSGCLVYPVTATCLSRLRWTPELADVQDLANWIYSWSRQPGRSPEQVLGNWEWLPGWASSTLGRKDYAGLSAMMTAGILALLATARTATASCVVTSAIALGGTAFWFFSAPDPRFALGFLFSVALLPLAFAASRARLLSSPAARVSLIIAIVGGAAGFVEASGVWRLAVRRPWPIPTVTWPPLPLARTATRVTDAGYELAVPVEGDQCWASPLPCTPNFDRRLGRDWALVHADQLSVNSGSTKPSSDPDPPARGAP